LGNSTAIKDGDLDRNNSLDDLLQLSGLIGATKTANVKQKPVNLWQRFAASTRCGLAGGWNLLQVNCVPLSVTRYFGAVPALAIAPPRNCRTCSDVGCDLKIVRPCIWAPILATSGKNAKKAR
jgi:hypothetical protein